MMKGTSKLVPTSTSKLMMKGTSKLVHIKGKGA